MKQIAAKHNKELRYLETYKYTKTNDIKFIILSLKGHIKNRV